MAKRVHIKDIIGGIVTNIDKTLKVERVEGADLITTKLFVCDLKWVKVGDTVLDNQERQGQITEVGSNYVVFQKEDPFIWDSDVVVMVTEFTYLAGTPLDVNAEWLLTNIVLERKLPLFWFVLPSVERNNKNGQGIAREAEIKLYIIEQTDPANYTVNQHYSNVMQYLWDYYNAFFASLVKNRDFANVEYDDTKEFYRFGSESIDGFEANVLDANLSALEVRFTLRIRTNAKCLC